MHSGFNKLFSV